ncbi:hypothetical protein AB0M43_07265 [Longispora sp. NPDC051575]|uniref:hypothetical protein n=1 Tax=Longispora sp. NPDC051575 TaxID=3154943 RepID=UPI003443F6F4
MSRPSRPLFALLLTAALAVPATVLPAGTASAAAASAGTASTGTARPATRPTAAVWPADRLPAPTTANLDPPLYARSTTLDVLAWYDGAWTTIGDRYTASALHAGGGGVVAEEPDTGNLYAWDATPDSWTRIGGPAAQVVVDDTGHVFALSPDRSAVLAWRGGRTWQKIAGPSQQIYAGGDRVVFRTDAAGDLYTNRDTPGAWRKISGPSTQFTASTQGYVSRRNAQGSAEVWDGTNWTQVDYYGGRMYGGDYYTGGMWVLQTGFNPRICPNFTLFKEVKAGGGRSTCGVGRTYSADSRRSIYAEDPTAGVLRWISGSGTWQRIGDPVGWIEAG